jgi:hypothetical protein
MISCRNNCQTVCLYFISNERVILVYLLVGTAHDKCLHIHKLFLTGKSYYLLLVYLLPVVVLMMMPSDKQVSVFQLYI